MHSSQSLLHHVAIVLDASASMSHLQSAVRKVANEQIQNLHDLSKKHNQETRVSVYRFAVKTNLEPLK